MKEITLREVGCVRSSTAYLGEYCQSSTEYFLFGTPIGIRNLLRALDRCDAPTRIDLTCNVCETSTLLVGPRNDNNPHILAGEAMISARSTPEFAPMLALGNWMESQVRNSVSRLTRRLSLPDNLRDDWFGLGGWHQYIAFGVCLRIAVFESLEDPGLPELLGRFRACEDARLKMDFYLSGIPEDAIRSFVNFAEGWIQRVINQSGSQRSIPQTRKSCHQRRSGDNEQT